VATEEITEATTEAVEAETVETSEVAEADIETEMIDIQDTTSISSIMKAS
jgi:hypothetical protein